MLEFHVSYSATPSTGGWQKY